jgi:O-antigen/teichoic acid export membrane protein
MTLHRFAAASLTGAGYQRLRTICEFLAAALNVLVNILLIPVYGWHAAAASTIGTEIVLVASLWGVVWWIWRSESAGAGVGGA